MGESVVNFKDNSRKEGVIEFLEQIREFNHNEWSLTDFTIKPEQPKLEGGRKPVRIRRINRTQNYITDERREKENPQIHHNLTPN